MIDGFKNREVVLAFHLTTGLSGLGLTIFPSLWSSFISHHLDIQINSHNIKQLNLKIMLEENVKRIADSSEAIEKNTALLVELAKKMVLGENNTTTTTTTLDNVVTIAEKNGEKCVRVHAGKYDFVVALHDLGSEMKWDDAMKAANKEGMRLFTKEKGMLMFCFKDEINAALVELGGDPLSEDDAYWSSSEYSQNHAWSLSFYSGYVYTYSKSFTGYIARGVAEF